MMSYEDLNFLVKPKQISSTHKEAVPFLKDHNGYSEEMKHIPTFQFAAFESAGTLLLAAVCQIKTKFVFSIRNCLFWLLLTKITVVLRSRT
jgi:hypothetical protein